jgi:hypothetical protein
MRKLKKGYKRSLNTTRFSFSVKYYYYHIYDGYGLKIDGFLKAVH